MLIIVFMLAPEADQVIELFTTREACQQERNRIGFDMAEAYPYEADFRIECRRR
jgi:hypothetical protein